MWQKEDKEMESTTPKSMETGRFPAQVRPSKPAGFFSRAEAFFIDLAILSGAQLVGIALTQSVIQFFQFNSVVAYVKTFIETSGYDLAIGGVISTLLVIGYFTFFWSLVGFTPGKVILGLKVVRMDGRNISLGRAILRFFAYWVSAIPFFLGFFWVLWDPKRRSWHDKIAGTQVLYSPKKLI
jgi:uncharacterized RDD family membrane protein YckC